MKIKVYWSLVIVGLLAACMLFAGCDGSLGGQNPPLTGTVTIDGTSKVGEALTANTDNLDGTGDIFYQWKRARVSGGGATNISEATGKTYTPVAEDADRFISVTVIRAGYSGSVTSATVGPIAASTPSPLTGNVTIIGNPMVGQALTADTDGLGGTGAISYQWKCADASDGAATNITGATGSAYILVSADQDKFISVTVTRAGNSGEVTSAVATGPIEADTLTPLTGTVTISGTPTVGMTLSAVTTGVTNPLGGNFTYQWKRADTSGGAATDIAGANGGAYTLASADQGKYITVTVWNTAYSGSVTSAAAVGPVAAAPTSAAELDSITLPGVAGQPHLIYYFYQELALPTTSGGLTVTWTSSDPNYPVQDYPSGAVNTNLKRVRVRDNVDGTFNFNLTASVTKSGVTYSKTFPVEAREKNYYGYLLAYFTGDSAAGEQVRYALSRDGYNFVALNNNNPTISSGISRDKGLRDPFIVRGHDGKFRMVNTDMKSSLGWTSNRGIVLSTSDDLITWTHSQIRFTEKGWGNNYTESNLARVWAPETIYDRNTGQYLVHYALNYSGSFQRMFYNYANADFTDLTGTPALLYANPNGQYRIDMSIVNYNNVFHAVIKNEAESGAGSKRIEKLESSSLTTDYSLIATQIDGESVGVEGCELYRLIGTDTWIHMYDCYGNNRYGWKSSANMRDWTSRTGSTRLTANGASFTPRHGSVLPITQAEYTKLEQNTVWGGIANPTVTTPATLALHYTFDGGDATGSGGIKNKAAGYTTVNHGTISGSGGSLQAATNTSASNRIANFYTGTGTGTGTSSTAPGYIDMGSAARSLITGQDNYTIATYVRIETTPSGNGWFLWCLANTETAGQNSGRYTFFRAIDRRQTYSVSGYGTESDVSLGGNLATNRWYHVMYREVGNTGTIYIDGVPATVSIHSIGNTNTGSGLGGISTSATWYNWIGRPCFGSDSYMQRTRYADFRIYTGAISEDQIAALGIPAKVAQLNQ